MLKKVIVGLFCFVILAVSGVGAYVYTLNWNKHKGLVSKRFSQITGLNAAIEGNLKVEYFPTPKFTAGKVSFWKGNDKRNPLIEIDEIVANVELMPLLENKFNISSMILTKPTFNVSISDKGVSNWADVGGKGKNRAGNIEVSFRDIKLNNAIISYTNAQTNDNFEVPNISASVSAPSLKGPYKTDGKLIHNKNEMKFAGTITNNNGIKLNMNISNNVSNSKVTIDGTIGANAEGLFTFDTKNFEKIANIVWGDKTVPSTYNEDLYISFKYNNKQDALKLENFTTKYGESTVGTGSVDVKTVEGLKIVDAVFKMNKIDLNIFENISNDYIKAFKSDENSEKTEFNDKKITLNINADSAFYNNSESKNLIFATELAEDKLNVIRLGIVMPGNTNIKTTGSVDLKTLKYNFNNSITSDDFRVFASIFDFDVTKLANADDKKSIFKNLSADVTLDGDLTQHKVSIVNALFDSTTLKGNVGFVNSEGNTVVLADLDLSKIIFDRYINTNVKDLKSPSLQDKFVHQMNLIPWNKDWTVDANITVGNSVYNNIPLEGLKLSFSSNLDALKVNKLTIDNIAGTYLDFSFDADNIRSNPNFKELAYTVKSNDLPLFASTTGIDLGSKKLFNRKIFAAQGVLSGTFNEFNLSSVQKFDDVEFSYTGLVRNEDKVFVDGDIEFKSDNFINLLKDTGFSYTPDLPLTSFTVSGKLTGYNNLFELSNANSYLGANKVSGTLALDNTGDKPKLKGNFDIDKLELARWFDFDDRLISNTISNDEAFVSRPKFVENKIDFSDLSKVDFDLKTNIKSLVYNKKNYDNTALNMTLVDGILNVSKLNTHYLDSNIDLDFILDSNNMPTINGNYKLKGIALPNLGGSVYMIKNGLLNIEGEFNSLATSKKEFFNNLDATGEFELNNASIQGFDFDIIKFEFEQTHSTAGFEDKILNSLKSGTSVFPVIKGKYNITRGVIVSDNMSFMSPVVDMNATFNLNLSDWLFYTTFDAVFHNATFSDILKFKMTGSMNNPSVSVELSDTLQRIGSVEKMSKDIIKKEEQKKIDELNNKIRSIEKDINSTLTTISRIHYDVARFKPISSNEDVIKTYDSNIKLLQQTEKTIQKIKDDIFKAKDLDTLVNLNNKFLTEDAKLKFVSKTLEDNFIIDGKYIFDDIFNKIAWVYNVIQNNSSYYNNITDVYMAQVEYSKTSENPISSDVEEMLANSVYTVKNTAEKATELHNKFRDNYLSMIDTYKVADMKENNEVANQALKTMFTYAKQLNNDMVISLDKFREVLDIKARDYNDYMVHVPARVEDIDITKPTSPNASPDDNKVVVDDIIAEDNQETSEKQPVSENITSEKKTEKLEEAKPLKVGFDIKKGFSSLLSKFNIDILNKKQEKLISNVAFNGLSNIIPQEKPEISANIENTADVVEDTVEVIEEKPTITEEPKVIDIAQINIDKSLLPVKEDITPVEEKTATIEEPKEIEVAQANVDKALLPVTPVEVKPIIEDDLSLPEMLKSSIDIALAEIKNIEDLIIQDSLQNDELASNLIEEADDSLEAGTTMNTVGETLKVNPVVALNIGKDVTNTFDNVDADDAIIKKTDSQFKRKDVANVVRSINTPHNVIKAHNEDKETTLVASVSSYNIDVNTKELASDILKQDVQSAKVIAYNGNKFLFPADDTTKTTGFSGKFMHKNMLEQPTQTKPNKYLFAMNDNVNKSSGEIGKIAFLTVK